MRGLSASMTAALLLLVAIAASTFFFNYMNTLRTDIESESEEQLIDPKVPPKLLTLICYDGYGYMDLTLSQGQNSVSGELYYRVELDTGQVVAEDFLSTTLDGLTRVHIPYLFDLDERYKVSLSGKRWEVSDYCRPIDDPHLVLYLPFDGGSGTNAEDSSSYEQDGEITGATWESGKLDSALNFDGAGDYVSVSASEDLMDGEVEEMTVSTWISPYGNMTNWERIIEKDMNGFSLSFDNSSLIQWQLGNGTDYESFDGNTSISQNTWYFIVASYDSSSQEAQLFVNDVYQGNHTYTLNKVNTSVSDLYVGSKDGSGNFFNGTIDEVRVYSRLLSRGEMSALYEAYVEGR